MVKAEWLEIAKNNLIQIYYYINDDSVYYAVKTINEILKSTDNIELFPYMGRKVPEYNLNEIRELIYKSYRIIYSIESEKILIRGIWHSARKLPQQLIS